MEKKSIEVIIGKRSDGTSTKPTLKGLGAPGVPAEAGGRAHWSNIICPWCGAINHVFVSDYDYYTYQCWNCGNLFNA